MKIDVTEKGKIKLKEIYEPIMLETSEGNQFLICMRDSGLELGIVDTSIKSENNEMYINWHVVDNTGVRLLLNQAKNKNV